MLVLDMNGKTKEHIVLIFMQLQWKMFIKGIVRCSSNTSLTQQFKYRKEEKVANINKLPHYSRNSQMFEHFADSYYQYLQLCNI